jgi:hypothetical protein
VTGQLGNSEREKASKEKYENKYVNRLANVYITKYDKEGHDKAKEWYNRFLKDAGLRLTVRMEITKVLNNRKKPE